MIADANNSLARFTIETNSNGVGQLKWILKNKIYVDHTYQRDKISPNTIRTIKANWNWLAFGALIIAERDGTFFVVDGQHRLMAAMSIAEIEYIPCVVYPSSSIVEEAQSFLSANSSRSPVSSIDKYRASLVANDKLALVVDQLLSDLGIKITTKPTGYGQTSAITTIISQARSSFYICRKALIVSMDAAKSDDLPLKQTLIEGLFVLEKNLQGNGIMDDRFRKRVADIGGRALHRAALNTAVTLEAGGSGSWSIGILHAVNKGLKSKFMLKGRIQS